MLLIFASKILKCVALVGAIQTSQYEIRSVFLLHFHAMHFWPRYFIQHFIIWIRFIMRIFASAFGFGETLRKLCAAAMEQFVLPLFRIISGPNGRRSRWLRNSGRKQTPSAVQLPAVFHQMLAARISFYCSFGVASHTFQLHSLFRRAFSFISWILFFSSSAKFICIEKECSALTGEKRLKFMRG